MIEFILGILLNYFGIVGAYVTYAALVSISCPALSKLGEGNKAYRGAVKLQNATVGMYPLLLVIGLQLWKLGV